MLSRTITAAAVLISVPGHLELYNLAWVVFFKDYVFTLQHLPQLWRAFTCFFITGPSLGLIMDPFFLYHYSSQLETGAARFSAPGAYAFYLLFVAMVILVSTRNFVVSLTRWKCKASSLNLPGQPLIAVTVPGIEQDYPLRCAAFVIRKTNRAFVECGHGGIPD